MSKILFVSEYFYPRLAGGEVWSFRYCKDLVKQGHDVEVVTSKLKGCKDIEVIDGVKIIRIGDEYDESLSIFKRLKFGLQLYKYLKYLFKVEKYDLIISMAYIASLPTQFNVPKDVEYHSAVHLYFGKDWFKAASFPSALLNYMMEKIILLLDCPDKTFVPSTYLKNKLGRKNAEVLPMHVDVSFKKGIVTKESIVGKGKHMAVLIGNLHKIKNFDGFIKSVNDIVCYSNQYHKNYLSQMTKEEMVYVIIGDGPERKNLEKLIKKYDAPVILLGKLPREQTLQILSCADVFINTSHSESFGMAIMEAFLLGVPIISTPVGISLDIKEKHPDKIHIADIKDIEFAIPKRSQHCKNQFL